MPIPPTFFANPNNTIRFDGWATCSDDAPADVWMTWSGPEYGDVRFTSAGVTGLWPNEILPAWWNAMQCVAWIVTRDPNVVRLAAEPPPNLTAETTEAWDLPRDGINLLWLNLHVGQERAEAELEALVQAARDGKTTSTGLRMSDNARQPLTAEWWQDYGPCRVQTRGYERSTFGLPRKTTKSGAGR